MTTSGGEPIPSITDATLDDIAANGIWADAGLAPSPAVIAVSRALLAAVQGTETVTLPGELAGLVADIRGQASFDVTRIQASDGTGLSAFSIKLNDGKPHPVVIVPVSVYKRQGVHAARYRHRRVGVHVRGLHRCRGAQ